MNGYFCLCRDCQMYIVWQKNYSAVRKLRLYWGGIYHEYLPQDGRYAWQSTKNRHWLGPTKAEVSLVWLIGKKNQNRTRKMNFEKMEEGCGKEVLKKKKEECEKKEECGKKGGCDE